MGRRDRRTANGMVYTANVRVQLIGTARRGKHYDAEIRGSTGRAGAGFAFGNVSFAARTDRTALVATSPHQIDVFNSSDGQRSASGGRGNSQERRLNKAIAIPADVEWMPVKISRWLIGRKAALGRVCPRIGCRHPLMRPQCANLSPSELRSGLRSMTPYSKSLLV